MSKKRKGKNKQHDSINEVPGVGTNSTKLSKKGKLERCNKCLQTGHNTPTYKQKNSSLNSKTPS